MQDDKLSRKEFRTFLREVSAMVGGIRDPAVMDSPDHLFNRLDLNRDGYLDIWRV